MVSLKSKAVSICCALTLAASLVPVSALAEEESEVDSFAVSSQKTEEDWVVWELEPEVVTAETSAQALDEIATLALDEKGNPVLNQGEYVNWVDRVDVPDYALEFYIKLEKAVDNDGVGDYFIADKYFRSDTPSQDDFVQNGENQYVKVAREEFNTSEQRDEWLSDASSYLYAMIAAFDRDHPEVFWLEDRYAVASSRSDNVASSRYSGTVFFMLKGEVKNKETGVIQPFDIRQGAYASERVIKQQISDRDSAIGKIINGVSASADAEARVRYFNTVLTRNNEYNTNLDAAKDGGYPDAWECLSALEGRDGERGPVCEGYARAFKVLCDRSNIPCVLVDGLARGGGSSEAHMWNYVQIEGAWYGADVTWNDPRGGESGKVSGIETDKWLLVGADTQLAYGRFIDSHPVSNRVFSDRTAFTNGPTLSSSAYVKKPETSGPSTGEIPDPVDPEQPTPPTDPSGPETPAKPDPSKPEVPSKPENPTSPSTPSTGSTTKPTVKPSTPTPAPAPKPTPSKPVAKPSTPTKPAARPAIKAPTFKKTKVTKAKSSKKKTLTVTWKKATKSPVAYQVQCATDKKFKKGVRKATLKVSKKLAKKSSLSVTVKKLKAKKTYYVRVRAQYKVAGKTYYGPWATYAKKVKVK